ncbi:MAG: iron chelate uptake ABC transporter family permease subunit [Candidatus Methylomirabilales bacterium]
MIEILREPFFQYALMAGTVVALMCSFLGVYVLLKRVVFVGFALSHIASAGVAFALLLGVSPLWPALAFSLAGVAFFSQLPSRLKIPMEGVIGASYVLAAALGIICIAKYPVGEARTLRILFGNILSVETSELITLVVVFTLIAVVHFLFYKEFLFVSFDFETAQAQGLNARFWNLLLYLTLGIAIAAAIRSMGVLLVFAFLVAPPITARLVADRMGRMFLLAMVFGALSVPIGLYLAFIIDLPTGTAVAATTMAILLLVLLMTSLVSMARLRWVAALLAIGALILSPPHLALATSQEDDIKRLQQEVESLKETIHKLQEQMESQAEITHQQQESVQQGQPPSVQPPPPPPPAPEQQQSGILRQLGGLVLNPEMRIEGNFIYDKTWGRDRFPEADGFASNRFSIKEVELGFRSEVDPFARLEAIISGSNLLTFGEDDDDGERKIESNVELEEAFLTLTRLPLGVQAKLGLFRTSFGEFNDDDPEEFPEIDAPNVIVNLFDNEGEGWVDAGVAANYQLANPWTDDLTHTLWFGVFSGENEVAFQGAAFDRPVWFGRFETFIEAGDSTGMELGLAFAQGEHEGDGDRLRTTLANVHFELDYRDPILVYGKGFNFLGEFYLSDIEDVTGGTTRSYGGYALGQYLLTREWSIGARFDYSQCPGFENSICRNNISDPDLGFVPGEGREWAISPILIFQPSRFLQFRAQYKHTDRDFDDDSDEILLQALFIAGFERPEPF